jgi:hypothetical protein
MSISYQAKGEAQLGQQLKVQELNIVVTAAQINAATSIDLPLIGLSGAAATRVVTVKCGETVAQIISYSVVDQSTGAIVPLAVAPSGATSSAIATTVNASAIANPVAICLKYVVAE